MSDIEPKPQKRLDRLRNIMRLKHHSDRTENSDVDRIRQYILLHNKRYSKETGEH